jgi:hypothetical protein
VNSLLFDAVTAIVPICQVVNQAVNAHNRQSGTDYPSSLLISR